MEFLNNLFFWQSFWFLVIGTAMRHRREHARDVLPLPLDVECPATCNDARDAAHGYATSMT